MIAWYHALEWRMNVASPEQLACALLEGGLDVDEKSLFRYRTGSISPTAQRRLHVDRSLPGLNSVYERGPEGVPLWDSMWGPITPADWRLAEFLMPGGRWPNRSFDGLLCGDAFFAGIVEFMDNVNLRQTTGAAKSEFGPELTMLATAVRVCRTHEFMDRPVAGDLHQLLTGCLAIPGVDEALESYGLRTHFVEWIHGRFEAKSQPDARTCKASRVDRAWLSSAEVFLDRWTELRKAEAALREGLWLGLFGIPAPRRFAHS